MKSVVAMLLAMLSIAVSAQETESELINALALQSGSYMRSTPASYKATNLMGGAIQNYTPEALFDLSDKMWCSAQSTEAPHVFEMELTETFVIEQMVFDNRGEQYSGITAREVKVDFETRGAAGASKHTQIFELRPQEINNFTLEQPVHARIIRISILNNHGHKKFTEITEVKALGKPLYPEIKPIDINGRWQSNWGWVEFQQNGGSVNGYYKYNNGKIKYGGINRNQVTYLWDEKIIKRVGWTLLFLNSEGTRLTGVWCYDDDWNNYGFWIMTKDDGVPIEPVTVAANPESVPDPEPQYEVRQEVVEELAKTLKDEGKLVLYGINFATGSADISSESLVILDEVAEVLKANAKIKLRIEGHTDNVGSETYNQELSSQRALAVAEYLKSKHSIAAERLKSEGKGESMPVATNLTESGKAANRRVEMHQWK